MITVKNTYISKKPTQDLANNKLIISYKIISYKIAIIGRLLFPFDLSRTDIKNLISGLTNIKRFSMKKRV